MLLQGLYIMNSIIIFFIWAVGLTASLAGILLYCEDCPEMGLIAFLIAGCDLLAVNALLVAKML